MISVSSYIQKLEAMPDGCIYLHLKNIQDIYLPPPLPTELSGAKLVGLSAKVYPASFEERKALFTNDVLTQKVYKDLLSYVVGVVIDSQETPNGHIWLVFDKDSEVTSITDTPNVILRFKDTKHEGFTSIANILDFQVIVTVNLFTSDDDIESPRICLVAMTILGLVKPKVNSRYLAEKKL